MDNNLQNIIDDISQQLAIKDKQIEVLIEQNKSILNAIGHLTAALQTLSELFPQKPQQDLSRSEE